MDSNLTIDKNFDLEIKPINRLMLVIEVDLMMNIATRSNITPVYVTAYFTMNETYEI
jgi:hypothetical protein